MLDNPFETKPAQLTTNAVVGDWWSARVLVPGAPLGPGFSPNQTVYCRKVTWDEIILGKPVHNTRITVFNGRYGIRSLDQEQARFHLQLLSHLAPGRAKDIEDLYQYDLNR